MAADAAAAAMIGAALLAIVLIKEDLIYDILQRLNNDGAFALALNEFSTTSHCYGRGGVGTIFILSF